MKKTCLMLALACLPLLAGAQQSGNITASSTDCSTAAACLAVALPSNAAATVINLSGTFTATLQFEGTADATGCSTSSTWVAVSASPLPSGAAVTSATATGTWRVNAAGLTCIRTRASAFVSGPAVVKISVGTGSASIGSGGGSPLGFDTIGTGTNTTATMTCGTGCAIAPSGSGAITATVNANLTGPITSVGNATSIAAQTGTGSTFVVNAAPTVTTPTFNGLTTQQGNVTVSALATPVNGVVTPQTAGGGKTCTYKIVALLTDSSHTAASTGGTTADCANDLTAANHGNVVNWGVVSGETGGYDVYRTVFSGATPAGAAATGKIAHVATGVIAYTDAGANGDAASAPATNTTGIGTFASAGVGGSPTSGAPFQVGAPATAYANTATSGYLFGAYSDPTALGQDGNLAIFSTDAAAIDIGGTIDFGAAYTGTTLTKLAGIKGAKEDGVAGNYGGYLAFYTRINGGASAEAARFTGSQTMTLAKTIASYNGLATAGNGVPSVQAAPTVVTIGSGTSIGATSLCSTTLCPAGDYEINVFIDVTTACTTTGGYIVWFGWTDDQGAKTGSSTTTYLSGGGLGVTPSTASAGASLALASTNNFMTGKFYLHTTGAATGGLGSINYGTTATACGTGGPAVGKMYLTVVRVR